MASRCPDRFCLAASMSRSTSRSVRYSRPRLPTVAFTEVGAGLRSCEFSMTIALPTVHTVTDFSRGVTACQKTAEIEARAGTAFSVSPVRQKWRGETVRIVRIVRARDSPCAPTALPVARRWTVDGRSGWSYRDRPRQSLEIEWGDPGGRCGRKYRPPFWAAENIYAAAQHRVHRPNASFRL